MTKKLIAAMAAVVLGFGGTEALAQESRHEVAVSYGGASNSSIFSFLEDFTKISATAGVVKYKNKTETGAFSAEYFYHLSSRVGVGGVLAYYGSKEDIVIAGSTAGKAKANYYTAMPAVKISWLEKKNVGLYSKLGAGVTLRHEKQTWTDGATPEEETGTKAIFNFQASLIGLEAGTKRLRVFGELGFGEQGIVLAGLRYKF